MSLFGSVKVSNKAGWTKVFTLEKSILMIGGDSSNDIILPDQDGQSSVPVFMQLICQGGSYNAIRAINLRNTAIPRFNLNTLLSNPILPMQTIELNEGDQLSMGGYTLVFSLAGQGFRFFQRSEDLGAEVILPGLDLEANSILRGQITLTNFSRQIHTQFDLSIQGLPPQAYQIDPIPLLHAGGTETLALYFFHLGQEPPAGPCPVQIRVAAPEAFPGQSVQISFDLNVAPVTAYAASFGEAPSLPSLSANQEHFQALAASSQRRWERSVSAEQERLVPEKEPPAKAESSPESPLESVTPPASLAYEAGGEPYSRSSRQTVRSRRKAIPDLRNVRVLRAEAEEEPDLPKTLPESEEAE